MDRLELSKEVEPIVIKVWSMSRACVTPLALPADDQIVRSNTLAWARDEILDLIEREAQCKK